jgi:carbon starvation protein
MRGLMDYWYHFAIMFEALFILTTIDAGTRVARFLVQEVLGRAWAPLGRSDWIPGSLLSSLLVVAAWAYFIHTGSVSTIWPMFGIANQLLAAMALAIGTTVILKSERRRYAWVTLAPLSFVAVTTLSAGWLSIRDIFLPLARDGTTPADRFHGGLNASLTLLMMTLILLTIGNCVGAWARTLRQTRRPPEPRAATA